LPAAEPLTWSEPRDRAGRVLRPALLVLLGLAPLALGAVHEPVFVPLLGLGGAAGLAAWARARRAEARGRELPPLPGARLLLALHALVLLQLVPLPPRLLRLVSPGSFAFHEQVALVPLRSWLPVSVNPADTARGLAFLAGMSLLYLAVFRELAPDEAWRRRLAAMVVGVGLLLILVGLVQAASLHPTTIYGVWKPVWDWGVFGPYVSKNHFAGYLVMAIPLAFAFAAEAFQKLRDDWEGRRVGWVALGGRAGNALVRHTAVALALVIGLLAARSRGGFTAFLLSAAALPAVLPRRRQAAVLVLAVGVAAFAWVETGWSARSFDLAHARLGRLDLWADALRMFPHFPALGAGFNAFGTSYLRYQTVATTEWYGEAHNEYLQALLDMGLVGAGLTAALLVVLFRRAGAFARRSILRCGLFASLLALAAHNVVEFNWQIPANAATFVALAALAVAPPRRR
jgi:O-antigen ligase